MGNLFAFRRGENLIAVVPRLTLSFASNWEDTRLPLPGGVWRNVFTQEDLSASATASDLFRNFPVALMVKQPA
jgi:(1->4)-alpha-D-glucan 1-alpha-D-glucosylmutase